MNYKTGSSIIYLESGAVSAQITHWDPTEVIHINFDSKVGFFPRVFSCPGSSMHMIGESVCATLEFGHKAKKKTKKTKGQKDKNIKGQKDKDQQESLILCNFALLLCLIWVFLRV